MIDLYKERNELQELVGRLMWNEFAQLRGFTFVPSEGRYEPIDGYSWFNSKYIALATEIKVRNLDYDTLMIDNSKVEAVKELKNYDGAIYVNFINDYLYVFDFKDIFLIQPTYKYCTFIKSNYKPEVYLKKLVRLIPKRLAIVYKKDDKGIWQKL